MAIQAFAHLAWIVLFGYLATLTALSFIHANRGYHKVWYQSVKETDFNAPSINTPTAAPTQLYIPTQNTMPTPQYPPAQNIVTYPPQATPAPVWTGTPQQTPATAPYHHA
ncbi:hypothetical protein C0992_005563 [Termitomyces sp. T32_za158]|nr:hypothetical protein C0992_005563 [Termitomyces sp. T32_za158]